jgi:hypothetical protein
MECSLIEGAQVIKVGQLQAYRFPALSETQHAVFTRKGGFSPAPWTGLNLSQSVGDSAQNVTANFKLACQSVSISPLRTASSQLVHGDEVVVISDFSQQHRGLPEADILITRIPGLTLTMRFADCVPLMFFDRVTRSVGLAHAGWRGTLKNVMGVTVNAMRYHFDSRPENLTVVIGPSIGPCCYRVGEDVFDAAGAALENSRSFFRQTETGLFFDLWRANLYQAREAGLKDIALSRICTACRTDEFFSHRAERGKTGRFGVFLGIPGL